jgi:hypothetical protein
MRGLLFFSIKCLLKIGLVFFLLDFHRVQAQENADVCTQVFAEGSFQNDSFYPIVKEVKREELNRVLSMLEPNKQVELNSPFFEGSDNYGVSCLSSYLFVITSIETLMIYDLSEQRKVSEVQAMGFPTEVWYGLDDVYAMTLSIIGRSDHSSIVVNVSTGEILSNRNPDFQNQNIVIAVNHKILTESLSYPDGKTYQVFTGASTYRSSRDKSDNRDGARGVGTCSDKGTKYRGELCGIGRECR